MGRYHKLIKHLICSSHVFQKVAAIHRIYKEGRADLRIDVYLLMAAYYYHRCNGKGEVNPSKIRKYAKRAKQLMDSSNKLQHSAYDIAMHNFNYWTCMMEHELAQYPLNIEKCNLYQYMKGQIRT